MRSYRVSWIDAPDGRIQDSRVICRPGHQDEQVVAWVASKLPFLGADQLLVPSRED